MSLKLLVLFNFVLLKSAFAISLPASPILPDSQLRLMSRLHDLFQDWLIGAELAVDPVLELCGEFMVRIIVVDSDFNPVSVFENPDALRMLSVRKTENGLLAIETEY